MKKAIIALGLIALLIMLSGCPWPPKPPEPTELPTDFELIYGNGAMHLEWGQFLLEMDNAEKAIYTKSIMSALEKTYKFEVSEEERLEIYKTAVVNNFFFLNESYTDPLIMDGDWSEITIKANGETKTVSVFNYSQPQFEAIEREINALLYSKLGEDAFTFDDLTGDCEGKEIECQESESIECLDWQYFCSWDLVELTPEYCDRLENREECINNCIDNQCDVEVCDALMFEAPGCTECSAGCCSMCSGLGNCAATSGCRIDWIHTAGESWQFGGCENMDLCMDDAGICDYTFVSYQGYRYTSLVEEDPALADIYSELADALQHVYNEECEEEIAE